MSTPAASKPTLSTVKSSAAIVPPAAAAPQTAAAAKTSAPTAAPAQTGVQMRRAQPTLVKQPVVHQPPAPGLDDPAPTMNPHPSLHHAHSVPEPVSFTKRPSNVQVEPTAPVSSRTKALQPAEPATEEAPVAMRLQRSATIGSRPKTVLGLLRVSLSSHAL